MRETLPGGRGSGRQLPTLLGAPGPRCPALPDRPKTAPPKLGSRGTYRSGSSLRPYLPLAPSSSRHAISVNRTPPAYRACPDHNGPLCTGDPSRLLRVLAVGQARSISGSHDSVAHRAHGSATPPRGVLCVDKGRNLLVGGEPIQVQLREDLAVVERDLEGAAGRLHEGRLRFGESALELSDQTGRLGGVVSLDAVFDRDVHADSPLEGLVGPPKYMLSGRAPMMKLAWKPHIPAEARHCVPQSE